MTATQNRPPDAEASRPRRVTLDAAALTRCRRRIHLDHDPAVEGAPRLPPDPAGEQRKADAAAHRATIGARLAGGVAGTGWFAVPEGAEADRAEATAGAVADGAAMIWGATLPRAGGRRGGVELLVRLPAGGYVPLIVVRHRISDPGEGAVTSAVEHPWPSAGARDPARKVRSHPRDLLRLAHLHRMLEAAGWLAADDPHATWAGVVGMDADVVVWHDLAAGIWPEAGSTLAAYDLRFADRVAVATAAAAREPALAHPSRVTECRHCPWWVRCEPELVAADDVSIVVRGETAVALRGVGVPTVAALAGLDPSAEPPVPVPGSQFADMVALARAWRRGLPVVRRVPRVDVLRADVEVDVDMESFGESGAYLWGTLLSHPSGALPGDEEDGYRAFATWEPLPTPDEARSFAAFWGWFTDVRRRALDSGRTFAAYCYNEQAENRWLLESAQRFAGRPGIPPLAEVEAFIADPCWVDLYAVVDRWFVCAQGKGLKRIAPAAGFGWHDPEAGGENSMRWYRVAVGIDGAPPDHGQRERLLTYNSDDVAATQVLRRWMTSPLVEEVPLASDL